MTRPGSTAPSDEALPAGTWTQTARHGHVGAGVLYAQLQREDGSWTDAEVNLDAPTFANVDGVFVYEEAAQAVLAHTSGAPSTGATGGSGGIDAKTATAIGASVAAAGGKIAGAVGGGESDGAGGDDVTTEHPATTDTVSV